MSHALGGDLGYSDFCGGLPGCDTDRVSPQVNDSTGTAGSPGEVLSRRCVSLMKTALRPDMWPRAELKLQWFDKLLMTVVSVGLIPLAVGR